MEQVTKRTSDAVDVIGRERAEAIKTSLFGDKTEFSRTDAMMLGKAIRKEAIESLKKTGLKNSEIADRLSISEGTVRYFLS